MQTVTYLPVEALLAPSCKSWGFCSFVKSSHSSVHASICRRSFSIILLSWNKPFGSFERGKHILKGYEEPSSVSSLFVSAKIRFLVIIFS